MSTAVETTVFGLCQGPYLSHTVRDGSGYGGSLRASSTDEPSREFMTIRTDDFAWVAAVLRICGVGGEGSAGVELSPPRD
jgi:hypothetical protein